MVSSSFSVFHVSLHSFKIAVLQSCEGEMRSAFHSSRMYGREYPYGDARRHPRVGVNGYSRKDGTYVRPHTRRWPGKSDYESDVPISKCRSSSIYQLGCMFWLSALPIIAALFVYRGIWWLPVSGVIHWFFQIHTPWWLLMVAAFCLLFLLSKIWRWLVAASLITLLIYATVWLRPWFEIVFVTWLRQW